MQFEILVPRQRGERFADDLDIVNGTDFVSNFGTIQIRYGKIVSYRVEDGELYLTIETPPSFSNHITDLSGFKPGPHPI